MDESMKNITETYAKLGILDKTVVIVSADNGGNAGEGGNNFPLRGNKVHTDSCAFLKHSPLFTLK